MKLGERGGDERNAAEERNETTGRPVKERRENESERPDRFDLSGKHS